MSLISTGQIIEALPLVAMMLATGIVGGIMAGLLGIGGGIIIVPVLDFALGFAHVDPHIRMQVAVATSLATIIVTSVSSARAHHAKGSIDVGVARQWSIPIVIGAIVGVLIATHVAGSVLSLIFGAVALLVTIKMLLPLDGVHLAPHVPGGIPGLFPPALVGLFSSMMGIGGGTLSVPTMTLLGQPIHRAVGTASIFGLLISVPSTIGFMLLGWGDPRLPLGSLGYVNLIGFISLVPTTWIAAPWGAHFAHKMKPRHLSIAFGGFLLIVSIRMIYHAVQH